MSLLLWLGTAAAEPYNVNALVDLEDALADPNVDELLIAGGLDLSGFGAIAVDRDIAFVGLGAGVTLPPIGSVDAHLSLVNLEVVGATSGYPDSQGGGAPACLDQPCTVVTIRGSLTLDAVVIAGSQAAHAVHTLDADVFMSDTAFRDNGADEYSVLLQAEDADITVDIVRLEFSGNAGPLKVFDSGDRFVSASVQDSFFYENLGNTYFAPDLYFWGVEDVVASTLDFEGSVSRGDERGAMHLHDSSGVLSVLTFTDGAGLTVRSDYEPVDVEVYGLTCNDTVSNDLGGCFYSYAADSVYLSNVWALGSSAPDVGGAIAIVGGFAGQTVTVDYANLLGTSASSNGGGMFFDNVDAVVFDARICNPSAGDEGSGVYMEDGSLSMQSTAIQGSMGGPSIFLQNSDAHLTNLTVVGGEDDFLNGRSQDTDWLIENSIFYGQRAMQEDSENTGNNTLRYNLFAAGAMSDLPHDAGYIDGDPGYTDDDIYDCYAELIPAVDSAAVDGNPTQAELDGTGTRDLGWFWGQGSEDPPDTDEPIVDDTGDIVGFVQGPYTGGCSHAPAGIGLLGLLLAATRRRC